MGLHYNMKLGMIRIPPHPDGYLEKARLFVCGAARDVDDASFLMEVLGLSGGDHEAIQEET